MLRNIIKQSLNNKPIKGAGIFNTLHYNNKYATFYDKNKSITKPLNTIQQNINKPTTGLFNTIEFNNNKNFSTSKLPYTKIIKDLPKDNISDKKYEPEDYLIAIMVIVSFLTSCLGLLYFISSLYRYDMIGVVKSIICILITIIPFLPLLK